MGRSRRFRYQGEECGLTLGDFDGGWEDYRSRLQCHGCRALDFEGPGWQGEALPNRRLLLYAEQGIGDSLQFIRYAPQVAARVEHLVVECRASIAGLIASVPGVDEVVVRGAALPAYDAHASLLGLPRLFWQGLDAVPCATPYLRCAVASSDHWVLTGEQTDAL